MESRKVRGSHYIRVVEFQGGEKLEAGLNRIILEEESKSTHDKHVMFKELTTFSSEHVMVFEVSWNS